MRLVPLGNQARNRNISGALGEICGFQAFTSLKTNTGAAGHALAYNSFFYLALKAVCFSHGGI